MGGCTLPSGESRPHDTAPATNAYRARWIVSDESDKPTPEEIARVEAWRRREGETRRAESRRKQEAQEHVAREALAARIVGRKIEAVEGHLYYSDWRSLELVLEGGVRLTVEYSSFSDPPELDVEVEGP